MKLIIFILTILSLNLSSMGQSELQAPVLSPILPEVFNRTKHELSNSEIENIRLLARKADLINIKSVELSYVHPSPRLFVRLVGNESITDRKGHSLVVTSRVSDDWNLIAKHRIMRQNFVVVSIEDTEKQIKIYDEKLYASISPDHVEKIINQFLSSKHHFSDPKIEKRYDERYIRKPTSFTEKDNEYTIGFQPYEWTWLSIKFKIEDGKVQIIQYSKMQS